MDHNHVKEMIAVSGGHLGAFSVGEGPAVLFLHGGPGDTHHCMRRMAHPLISKFQCIFFDQRGTGASNDFAREPSAFHTETLIADVVAVADHFHLERASLVGHSWGAMLALFVAARQPRRFESIAAISMGPLDQATSAAVSEALLAELSALEQVRWHELRRRRNEARARGDLETVLAADRELMFFRVRSWVFEPELRGPFLAEYFSDPPPDRVVNNLIWSQAEAWFDWRSLAAIESRVWLCSGANDSVPIAQARRVSEMVSRSEVAIFDRCGHMPWLEHPAEFYERLARFINGGDA